MAALDSTPAAKQPLGTPFWRLFTASGLSDMADGTLKVSLPLVAIRFTDSPALISGLAFALMVPWLLFALPAGALADRFDRRRAMLAANVARTAVAAVLAATVLFGLGSIWTLYAAAVCLGTAETVYDTSAQSMLPLMLPRELLSRANSRLFAVQLGANEFAGPPLGGLLVAVAAALAFATPAALWAVALGGLLLVPGSFRVERERPTSMRADIAEGLRFLRRHRLLRTLAVMVGVFNFASNAVFAILVLYAVGPHSAMRLSAPAYGALFAMTAAGSLLGFLVAERIESRLGRARSLTLTIVGNALQLGLPALSANPFLVGAGFLVGGSTNAVWNVITVSLRQRITPPRLLGRLNSAYRLLAWGTRPIGAVAGGVLAEAFGLRAVFAIMAPLALALLLGMTVVTDAAMDAAERDYVS